MKERKLIIIGGGHLLVQEILDRMGESRFPVNKVQLLCEGDRIGEIHEFRKQAIIVGNVKDMVEEGYDAAVLLSSVKDLEKITRDLVFGNVPLIDMANHFEATVDVPVLQPDSNKFNHQSLPIIGIIPTRTAQALSTILEALKETIKESGGLRQASVFSLEGVSCMGSRQAMDELFDQTRNILAFIDVEASQFPRQIAFNAFHEKAGAIEDRIIQTQAEGILHQHDLIVTTDRAWSGFFVGILGTIWLESRDPMPPEKVLDDLSRADDIEIRDSLDGILAIVGQDNLIISDLRTIPGNPACLTLRFGMDNLHKGSASTFARLLESVWMEART